jgi:ribosomal protein S18 acetylase RimI-like enzyme
MTHIIIRDYQKKDWSQILQMIVESMEYHISIQNVLRFKTYTPDLLRNFLRGLVVKQRLKKGKFLVAEEEGILIGFIYGEVDKQDKELAKSVVKSGTIFELFVLPSHRKHQVAQTLMNNMEGYLMKNGCLLIRLKDVHFKNTPAQSLYSKLGYEPRTQEFAKIIGD